MEVAEGAGSFSVRFRAWLVALALVDVLGSLLLHLLMYAWCWLVALDTDNSRTFSPELEVAEGADSSPEARNLGSLCCTRARLPV